MQLSPEKVQLSGQKMQLSQFIDDLCLEYFVYLHKEITDMESNTNNNVFLNFLRRYCMHLADRSSFSYRALSQDALAKPRVFEPFCVLCVYSDHVRPDFPQRLLDECRTIQEAGERWPEISRQYEKLYNAWQYSLREKTLKKETKQHARHLIEKKFGGAVPISELARITGISYSALYQFFRQNDDQKLSVSRLWEIYRLPL